MKNVLLVLIALAVLGAGTAPAAILPAPDRSLDRETLLERLVDAQTAFLSWNLAGAKARLDRLVADLALDTTPFNVAVRQRASEVIRAIESSRLRDAETKLAALIKAVRDGVMPSFADLGDSQVI